MHRINCAQSLCCRPSTRTRNALTAKQIDLIRKLHLDQNYKQTFIDLRGDFEAAFEHVMKKNAFIELAAAIRSKAATPRLIKLFFEVLGKNDIDDYMDDGETLLTLAGKSELPECMTALCRLGADPSKKNSKAQNAFDFGLSPNSLTWSGRPLLNQAIFNDDFDSIVELIERRADPGVTNPPNFDSISQARARESGITHFRPPAEVGRNALTLAISFKQF